MISSSFLLRRQKKLVVVLLSLFLYVHITPTLTNAQQQEETTETAETTETTDDGVLGNKITYPSIKYNEVRQKDSHNSYERHEGILDQMIYHHLRTVEIDCHLGFTADLYSVYHDAGYFQSYSSFNRLRDGIKLLLEFHDMFPNHHVVTVFMDLKGGFGNGELHTPQGFDDIIGQLPLWTPADAQGTEANSIREGIDQNGWPDLQELRGKFIWVLTSGQDEYCTGNTECVQRLSFVADKNVKNPEDVGKKDYAIFFNQKAQLRHIGKWIKERGYVGRIYDLTDINTPEKWDKAIVDQFQHITTDRINYHRDPFTVMHNGYGYPFRSYVTNDMAFTNFTPFDEGGNVMYMYAPPYGGDAWGRRDSIHYAYRSENYTQDFLDHGQKYYYDNITDTYTGDWIDYTTYISLSNSHCDDFAKAGIMLREKLADEDRFPLGSGKYFAVVRTCRELIRVQYRERPFMLTVAERLKPTLLDGIEDAKRLGIRLRYRYDGKHSHCEGYFKLEGRDPDKEDSYVLIKKLTFPNTQLTVHGLFASSHHWKGNEDGTPFKALFINSKRNRISFDASDFDGTFGYDNPAVFGDGYFPDPVKFPKVDFEEGAE